MTTTYDRQLTVRRAGVPTPEQFTNFTADQRPPLNSVMITIRKGDIIDVGILWGAWLKANAGRLKTSSWAAAGAPVASPQAPTITTQLLNESSGETVALLDTTAAAVGDTYYLENTITFGPDREINGVTFPDRTAARRIHVKVAAG